MENEMLQIVELAGSEWLSYKSLRLEALANDPQAFSTSLQEASNQPDSYWQSRLEEAGRGQGSWLLFAREGQSLVGMIAAVLDQEREDTAIILSVYVSPTARGKGFFKKLMAALLNGLKQGGVKKAWLEVNPQQLPALALYTNFGFKTVSIKQNLPETGRHHDEYRMEKDL